MRTLMFFSLVLAVTVLAPGSNSWAATVSCEVKELSGSTMVLENCDERLLKEFKKGNKVKVRQQNKKN